MKPTKAQIAEARIRRAMVLVERAQNDLARAAADLSVLRYGDPTSMKVYAVSEKAHAVWYRVRELLSNRKIELDHDEPSDSDRRDFPALFEADGARS